MFIVGVLCQYTPKTRRRVRWGEREREKRRWIKRDESVDSGRRRWGDTGTKKEIGRDGEDYIGRDGMGDGEGGRERERESVSYQSISSAARCRAARRPRSRPLRWAARRSRTRTGTTRSYGKNASLSCHEDICTPGINLFLNYN